MTGRSIEEGALQNAVVRPREYAGALRNPLKGLRAGDKASAVTRPYATLARIYIKWNDIENTQDDGVDRINAFCDQAWEGLHLSNTKVIPRVYLEWPDRGRYWPADLTPGDYSSPQFMRRLVGLIEKLGAAWNKDPRVAFVETGVIGLWGEQHDPEPTAELQKLMGDAYTANFPNKLLMNRYPWQFVDYDFGINWDSFGHKEESPRHIPLLKSPRLADRWMTAPMGGETAFDWGTPLGKDPTDAVANNSEKIIALIRDLHWNHLGWLSDYDLRNPRAVINGGEIQKALGYRFIIDEASYPVSVTAGKSFQVSFRVRNTGSSPFYYSWPIEFSFLDPATRKPVWKKNFQGVDMRKWLPSAQEYTVTETFVCPADLPVGIFTSALAILDPAGNVPAARFAITNYYKGGRHPLGWTGADRIAPSLPTNDFDDLAQDQSLQYTMS